jgi:hypothetical protein
MVYGGKKGSEQTVANFIFRNNVVRHNSYGVHGADRAPGQDSIDAYFPGAVFTGNVIAGGESKRYPSGNTFIDPGDFAGLFIDSASGDYRPRPGGRLAGDGKRPAGANIAAVMKAVRDVAGTRP